MYQIFKLINSLKIALNLRKKTILVTNNKNNYRLIYILHKYNYIYKYNIYNNNILLYLKYYNNIPFFNIILKNKFKNKYVSYENIMNLFNDTFIILSTSKGILSSKDCIKYKIGGRIVCLIN